VETLDPAGELWINGEPVAVLKNRHPAKLDISKYLQRDEMNLIAVRVQHFNLSDFDVLKMPHTSTDENMGWFAGRMWIDLVEKVHIEDVFVYALRAEAPARLNVRIRVKEEGWGRLRSDVNYRRTNFRGSLQVRLFEWHPHDHKEPTCEREFKIDCEPLDACLLEQIVEVDRPRLWSFASPNLYKVQVILKDEQGLPVDDYVVTTGIRTVSQEGGVFRINGKPEMINGAQLMGFRPPLDKIATWSRCAPKEWLVKEILMNKKLNGNGLKVQIHQWQEPARNVNDPRMAEIGDQLGFMFIWGTTGWIRTGSPWGVDFDGYPKYMEQVYNHPSIVMWLVAGHPRYKDIHSANRFYRKVHETLFAVDPSRLISPDEYNYFTGYANDAGTIDHQGHAVRPSKYWTAKNIVRANQDPPTGYGNEWSILRKWPDEYRKSLLQSKERAYFNIEHEEAMGQPNWELRKGKPSYKLHSYEWTYDVGSIGRRLTFQQWRESQAWQAFSAYEATRKERILDYDGFSWCCLHGGGNTATYHKPLIDYYGHAKLAFYTTAMSYQRILAGSDNVDVVYGPADKVTPVIINLGEAKIVDLEVVAKDSRGRVVQRKLYDDVAIAGGRTVKKLAAFRPDFAESGYYALEYYVRHRTCLTSVSGVARRSFRRRS
jgi:hypothetical protein